MNAARRSTTARLCERGFQQVNRRGDSRRDGAGTLAATKLLV